MQSQTNNPTQTTTNIANNITTMVRIRPLLALERDQKESIFALSEKSLQIRMLGGHREENVEKIFNPTCTQRSVFEDIRPLLSRSSDGYNVTIFTYGQTGSGKTYTMFGSDWSNIIKNAVIDRSSNKSKQATFLRSIEQDQNHAGLIPRAIHHIFNNLIAPRRKYIKVFCSFLQLYNEQIMDLLEDDRSQLHKKMLIHENKKDGVYVEGLNEIQVDDVEHCLELMQRGQRNRIVRQTHMNEKSSRSHTIFQLLVEEVFPSTKTYRRVKINLCDLAGSEKINKSIEKIQPEHLDQLKNINLSLTTLGKVISSLAQKNKSLPFRESKLTRLLQDSLGGNTYTAIIATITTKSSSLEESLNTLKFLERAKQVKTSISNKIYSDNPQMKNLQKQIAYLKDVLRMKRTGVDIDPHLNEKYKHLQVENQRLKEMVDKDLVERLMKENSHLKMELTRKSNEDLLESRQKFSAMDLNYGRKTEDMVSLKAKNLTEQSLLDAPDNKIFSNAKPTKMMSTKTYTIKSSSNNRSTGKSTSKLFPSITRMGKKNSASSILARIHEIQKIKQANRLKLEHELTKIGQERDSSKGRKEPYFANSHHKL